MLRYGISSLVRGRSAVQSCAAAPSTIYKIKDLTCLRSLLVRQNIAERTVNLTASPGSIWAASFPLRFEAHIYKCVGLVFAALMLAGCDVLWADPAGAQKVLTDAGYTSIKITGYRWFACSRDESGHTGFTATGPTGRPVVGVVCNGIFKSYTIRLSAHD